MPTYWDYLKLDSLLELQSGLDETGDPELPDELHFIVVHQVYELWFKLTLRSLRHGRDALLKPTVDEEMVPVVAHHLRRAVSIFNLGVAQFEVMETLQPQDFLAFRDKLTGSSGFQSFQMREIEIVLGLEAAERIRYGKVDPLEHIRSIGEDTPATRLARHRIETASAEPSVREALQGWLYRTPIQGSTPDKPDDAARVAEFVESYLIALDTHNRRGQDKLIKAFGDRNQDEVEKRFRGIITTARNYLNAVDVDEDERPVRRRARAAILFIESYRDLPLLSWPRLLLDVVVQLEEQLVLWRARHARMVERLIGHRPGTGGSAGVAYLDQTASYRIFKDLWATRTLMLPKSALPDLIDAELYGYHEPS
ncbi:MAG: tryptophan 2,3-dioxygenase [Myxococcota bacterium]